MAGDVESFPPAIQWIIYGFTAIGVTIAAIIGGRKRGVETTDEQDARLAKIERQLADQKEIDSKQRERDRTDKDMIVLRQEIERNLKQVIKAQHDTIAHQIAEIERQTVGIKQQLARLSRKQPK